VRLTVAKQPVNVVVFDDGDQHLSQIDAQIRREFLCHLLVEGLFGFIRAADTHDQVHHEAIRVARLILQTTRFMFADDLTAIATRKSHRLNHRGVNPVADSFDVLG
jgi:hypothetical protein